MQARNGRSRAFGWLPAAVAGAAFALYAATACRTVPFGDGGELIAVSNVLGIAHPPGYPLYTFLGNLALRLPLGEPAFRMNLLSALFGALTCGVVARLVLRSTDSKLSSVTAGLGLAVSSTFWTASTVAEVYTLHLSCLACGLLLADGAGRAATDGARGRGIVLTALAFGIGLSHHPTILVALPGVAVLLWPRRGESGRSGVRASRGARLLAAGIFVGVPILAFVWLLARAKGSPAVSWGRPDTLDAAIAHATARRYAVYDLGWSGLLRGEGWIAFLRQQAAEWTLPVAAWAFLGLFVPTRGPTRGGADARTRIALVALVVATALFGLRYATEDAQVFFLPVAIALSVGAGRLAGAAFAIRGRAMRVLGAAIAVATIVMPILAHGRAHDLRRMTAARLFGRDMLASVPDRGILFVEGDDAFLLAYLTTVLNERPDVTIYDRAGNLFRDQLRERGIQAARGESALSLRIRRELDLIAREATAASPRPVVFMAWPGYDLPAGLRFEPAGLFYQVRRAASPPLDPAPLWATFGEKEVLQQVERTGDALARTFAATYPLMRAERLLFEGNRAVAAAALGEASAIGKGSETIHNTIGTIYGRIGDLAGARREFESAIAVKPVSRRAWNNLGKAHLLSGDPDGARRAWSRSLELDPAQPEIREQLRALR